MKPCEDYYAQPPASGISFLLPYVLKLDLPALIKSHVGDVLIRLKYQKSTEADFKFLFEIFKSSPPPDSDSTGAALR